PLSKGLASHFTTVQSSSAGCLSVRLPWSTTRLRQLRSMNTTRCRGRGQGLLLGQDPPDARSPGYQDCEPAEVRRDLRPQEEGYRGGRPPSLDQIPTLAATSSSGGSAWPNSGAGLGSATTSTPSHAEPLPSSARYRLATQIGDTPWSSGP